MTDTQPEKYLPASVLVIAAHPDDIDFGVAGSVAKWTAHGARVTYCIVTDGSSGSNDPNIDLEELIATRQNEQTRAAAAVGVNDIRWLGYKDGTLTPSLELRRDLTRLIRELKPERVVTFDPTTIIPAGRNYINHPDHRATGEAALYAVFPSAESRPIFPELLIEGYEPHKVKDLYMVLSDDTNTYVDISDHIEAKAEALACHASQLDDKVVKMVTGWNASYGEKVGVRYAEVFRVMYPHREDEQGAAEQAEGQS
ncbi:MAG: PIG-L deacetylase family protein [Anaerolineales bacterium]